MEQHGKNPKQNVIAIIPARFSSTRLEDKLLLPLNGKPLILHTLEQAKKAKQISRVIVATDDERIMEVVEQTGNEVILTSKTHQSGSDRIAEVAKGLAPNSIIVNVQGDEPLISPHTIDKAVEAMLEDETIDISTTCEEIFDYKDILSPDVVKVVTDKNGFALYFSRSPIPFPRNEVKKYGSLKNALRSNKDLLRLYRKHTGLYVYRREFLLEYTRSNQTQLETTEMLEQLRALENRARIKVVKVSESSIGVDTQADYRRVRELFESRRAKATDFIYRKATSEDIQPIAKVHIASWRESFRGIVPQDFLDKMSVKNRIDFLSKRFLNSDVKFFVAENTEKNIIGFAEYGRARNKKYGCDAELYAIYFLREFQRKGIGSKLFQIGIRDLINSGYESMYLEALVNSPFKSFYEKMGGKLIGQDNFKMDNENFNTVIYGWDDLTII